MAPLARMTSPSPRSRLAELSLINLGYSSPFPDRVNTSGPPKPMRPTHGMPVYQTSNISHPCVPNCTRSSSKTGAMIGAARSNGGRRRRPRRRQRPPSLTRPRTGLMPRGNPDNLRAAAQRKRREATERAEAALAELARRRQPVTFHGLAKAAGVSADFLYRSPLRARIEELRATAQITTPAVNVEQAAASDSQVVRALAAQVANSRAATTKRPPNFEPHSRPPTARTSSCAGSSAAAPTNAKVERFHQTPVDRWARGAVYGSSAEPTAALPGSLNHYNFTRPHGSLAKTPPGSRLTNWLGTSASRPDPRQLQCVRLCPDRRSVLLGSPSMMMGHLT